MGKDLKSKELGTGITQRKDGMYLGRFTSVTGKRVQKVFSKLQECRKWLSETQYNDQHRVGYTKKSEDVTLDAWFDYWINVKKRAVRTITVRNNTVIYNLHIHPMLGNKLLSEITTAHCQILLNVMADKGLKTSTIRLTESVLKGLLESAVQYDIITKNPCNKAVKSDIGRKSVPRQALTIDEQVKLCKAIEGTVYEYQYRLLLQTGLRIGELIGLRWSDIDFKERTLKVRRSAEYIAGKWEFGEPKTNAGKRMIPLTDEAALILQAQFQKNKRQKVVNAEWVDSVFINRNGTLIFASCYIADLKKKSLMADIPIISPHILRHTFATRCIEAGMQPKTLQAILGHSNITMTLNLYVHVTEEYKVQEMDKIANALKIV